MSRTAIALSAALVALTAAVIAADPARAQFLLNPPISCEASPPSSIRAVRQRSERQTYWQWEADSYSYCHTFSGADDYGDDYDVQVKILYELHEGASLRRESDAYSSVTSYTLRNRTRVLRRQPVAQFLSTCKHGRYYAVKARAYFRYKRRGTKQWTPRTFGSRDYEHSWSKRKVLC